MPDMLRSEEPGWHQPPWPQALAATVSPPNPVPKHQAYTHEQHSLAAWELDMSTAHEYVMAAEGVPTTMSFDATLHVGYMLSDSSAPALAQVVQEIESLLSLFKLDDDDVIPPPQTRSSSHKRFAVM